MKNPKKVVTSIPREILIKIMSHSWQRMGEWEAPVLYEDIYCQGLINGVPEFFPGIKGPEDFLHCAPVSYQDVIEYSAHAQVIGQHLYDSPTLLPNLISRFKENLSALRAYTDPGQNVRYARSLRKAKQLLLAYLKDLYNVMSYSYIFNWGKEAVIGETVRLLIRTVEPNGDIHAIYRSFFDPPPPDDAQWFREEWALVNLAEWAMTEYKQALPVLKRKDLQIIEVKSNHRVLYLKLRDVARSYGWLGVRHMLNQPRSSLYYLKRLREILILGIDAKRQALMAIGQEAEANFTSFLSAYELTPERKAFLICARELVGLSTLRVEGISRSAWAMRPVFNTIASTLGITPRLLLNYTWRELQQGDKETALFKKDLGSRTHGYAYLVLRGNPYLITGSDLRILKRALIEFEKCEPTILRGQSASAGLVIGETKVINEQQPGIIPRRCVLVIKDADHLDISLLKNAVAIVADQGGILSKVASYAREVGIPCVVGTVVGTETIRDGNLLEVDGTAGVCLIRRPRSLMSTLV